jgi:hypothetical protein
MEIDDTNACILLPSVKSKLVNLMCLRRFFAPELDNSDSGKPNDLDFNNEQTFSRPLTRALKNLME